MSERKRSPTNRPIEPTRPTRSDAILPQRVERGLLELLVLRQAREIVRRKVDDGFVGVRDELDFGACRTGNDGERGEEGVVGRGQGGRDDEGFRRPVEDELVDFLVEFGIRGGQGVGRSGKEVSQLDPVMHPDQEWGEGRRSAGEGEMPASM
jgi:hypothetical protein